MSHIISNTYSSSVFLSATVDSPLTITSAGLLNAGLYLESLGSDWMITNAGSVLGHGVDLMSGGTVINAGSVSGTIPINIAGSVPPGRGIELLAGGSVTNQSGGTISGYGAAIYGTSGSVTVVNAGSISGNSPTGAGVVLHAGGNVTNQIDGEIGAGYAAARGGYFAIKYGFAAIYGKDSSVDVVNAGYLAGGAAVGVILTAGGDVINQTSGTIRGYAAIYSKLELGISPVTVVNAGSIDATGPGVFLSDGGSVTNQSGGLISGNYGVANTHPRITPFNGIAALTLVNAGTIEGSRYAVALAPGYANRLVIDPGAIFSGLVTGGNKIGATTVSTLELATGTATGTISGLGTQFVNFGSIAFDKGADWFVEGNTSGLAGRISGFAPGDTIEVTDITVTGSNYADGVLTLSDYFYPAATLDLQGSFATSDFVVTSVADGAYVTLVCFCAVHTFVRPMARRRSRRSPSATWF